MRIGYYDQRLGMSDIGEEGDLEPDATVYDALGEGRTLNDNQIRSILGMLLFRGDDVEKRLDMLSGGERARVRLAQLLADKPNVLILDEPTNHLDVASCAALERALAGFEGTVLCVSHDRYFLDQLAKRLLIMDPPVMEEFVPPAAGEGEVAVGAYTAWALREKQRASEAASAERAKEERRKQSQPKASLPPKADSAVAAGRNRAGRDNPYTRPFGRLSTEELEERIGRTELELGELQAELTGAWKDGGRVRQLQGRVDELAKVLEQLNEEYYGRA